MPLKNKKAHQAKTQRVQGEKFFKKGFIDNLDNQNDPDWVDKEDSDVLATVHDGGVERQGLSEGRGSVTVVYS